MPSSTARRQAQQQRRRMVAKQQKAEMKKHKLAKAVKHRLQKNMTLQEWAEHNRDTKLRISPVALRQYEVEAGAVDVHPLCSNRGAIIGYNLDMPKAIEAYLSNVAAVLTGARCLPTLVTREDNSHLVP